MSAKNLSRNLRVLCDRHGSIAEVCRRIDINRQQFNRYLSGETRPSGSILRKIADFFRVPGADLDLDVSLFARRHDRQQGAKVAHLGFGSAGEAGQLDRYCRYYHTYFRWTNHHKAIVKGFARIYRDGDVMRSKVLDRYIQKDEPILRKPVYYYKMNGLVSLAGGFLYILDNHKGLNESYTMTCLYPSYTDQVSILTGMMIGVSSYLDRRPFASNLAYVAVDHNASLIDAVRQCGVYPEDSEHIPRVIRHLVQNRIKSDLGVLIARGLS